MTILYITMDGLSDPLGQSQIFPYLNPLLKKGYSVGILSMEKPSHYFKINQKIRSRLDGGIQWYPIKYHSGLGTVSSMFNMISLFIKLVSILISQSSKIRIIHTRSFLPTLLVLLIKRIHPAALIYDMRGFWTDERKETRSIKSGFIYNILKFLEKKMLLRANKIVSLSQKGIIEMKQWLPILQHDKFVHIPTCCDTNSFLVSCEKNISREFISSSPHLLFHGSMGLWYPFSIHIRFVKFIKKLIPDSKFTFLLNDSGNNKNKENIHSHTTLQSVSYNTLTHFDIPESLGEYDIGFFFITPSYSKIASCPTKMGEMLAAGIPIITGHSIGDVDEIIHKYNIGYVVQDFTEEEFKKAIDYVMNMLNQERQSLIRRCRQAAEENFSLEKAVEKYAVIYNGLLQYPSDIQ